MTESDARDQHDEPPVYDLDDPEEPVEGVGDPPSRRRVSDTYERERLVARTVADATARDTRYQGMPWRPAPAVRWWKWGVASLLVAAALLALAVPPAWVAGPPPPAPSPADREAGVAAALFLQAGQIEAFRARTGRLPETLDEVGATFPGIRYVRSNTRVFQLVASRADGTVTVWDSAEPPPEQAALARRWLAPPGEP